MFDANVPARDAEAVARARAAGAILVGKTQTHEFAWGITSVNELTGSAHNPWALDRVSGGSSGGSAVVLAAGEVPLALGSDTGGSIRVPAAFCGIVGLKPTYGRISAAGAWPLARSLDHPGPMSTTPAGAALLLEAIAGVDARDPATVDVPLGDVQAERARGLDGLVVGVCTDLELVPLAADVRAVREATVRTLTEAGAELVDVELPEAELILPTFRTIQSAEALETHRAAGLYPARRGEYGPDVLGRLEAAEQVTVEDYLRASADRERVRAAFARLFRSCDVLLTPVGGGSPVPIGQETVRHEGVELTFRDLVMSYTTPQDLVGLPACTVRAGFDALGIPVGMQFTAPAWQEGRVLRAAQGVFDATPEIQAKRPLL
jgi:aspartyl-tRNA(Asn)/glutamyl-tRNA(Gln) amidotransferase subunit A